MSEFSTAIRCCLYAQPIRQSFEGIIYPFNQQFGKLLPFVLVRASEISALERRTVEDGIFENSLLKLSTPPSLLTGHILIRDSVRACTQRIDW